MCLPTVIKCDWDYLNRNCGCFCKRALWTSGAEVANLLLDMLHHQWLAYVAWDADVSSTGTRYVCCHTRFALVFPSVSVKITAKYRRVTHWYLVEAIYAHGMRFTYMFISALKFCASTPLRLFPTKAPEGLEALHFFPSYYYCWNVCGLLLIVTLAWEVNGVHRSSLSSSVFVQMFLRISQLWGNFMFQL